MIDIVKTAHPTLDQIAETVRSGHRLNIRVKSSGAAFKSGVVNYGFTRYMIANIRYTINDDCTGCGKCEKLCPANNIKMLLGRPQFSDRCMGCYACIHKCPQKAINLGKRTENKTRYECIPYEKEIIQK